MKQNPDIIYNRLLLRNVSLNQNIHETMKQFHHQYENPSY